MSNLSRYKKREVPNVDWYEHWFLGGHEDCFLRN
jgi:hypothetical protein